MSAPSTLLTNGEQRRAPRLAANACSGEVAIAGPRSLPPMPMLTTVAIRSPVAPTHSPLRTRLGERAHPVEHLVHVGTTSWPSTSIVRRPPAPAARCAARPGCSVVLICSPANIASRRSATPAAACDGVQRGEDVVVDQVLRVVDAQVAGRATGTDRRGRGRSRTARAAAAEVAWPAAQPTRRGSGDVHRGDASERTSEPGAAAASSTTTVPVRRTRCDRQSASDGAAPVIQSRTDAGLRRAGHLDQPDPRRVDDRRGQRHPHAGR